MGPKLNFRDILEETYVLREKEEPVADAPVEDEETDEDFEDEDDVNTDDVPTGKGDYTADEVREIIDYVYDILDKEDDDELNESVGEIGLDLLYNYCDVMPQTMLNQIVDDLKEMFEIEDTMLESIMSEGAAFVKKKKGTIAKAAAKKARVYYKKNKSKLKMKGAKWRKSSHGKKLIKLHKKVQARLGDKKGMRLVTAPEAL
jgi:hypothetical protein